MRLVKEVENYLKSLDLEVITVEQADTLVGSDSGLVLFRIPDDDYQQAKSVSWSDAHWHTLKKSTAEELISDSVDYQIED